MDHILTGSGLLLSALLQNTVQGSGAPGDLAIASEGPYDFYHQPNMREARLCLSVLEKLDAAVKQRLQDWPDHPALVQVIIIITIMIIIITTAIFILNCCEGVLTLMISVNIKPNEANPLANLDVRPVTDSILTCERWRAERCCEGGRVNVAPHL